MNISDSSNIFEKIYNSLKKYCLNEDNAYWTIGHIKFYHQTLTAPYCSFDILTEYGQEPVGQCYLCLIDKERLVVSFKMNKEDEDNMGTVYPFPKITLPLNRYERSDDLLGRYFYLLVDKLYYMANFLSRM